MKTFVYYLSFCAIALGMILLRPYCANLNIGHMPGQPYHTFNAIQRVIKKQDSHEDAIEVTEIRQSAPIKVVLPPVIHPYDFLLTGSIAISSAVNHSDRLSRLSAYNTYFQVTSRLRI